MGELTSRLSLYAAVDEAVLHRAGDVDFLEFVSQFIGEDRALRRLALRRVGELELDGAAEDADRLPVAAAEMTARNALALMLESRRNAVRVVGDDGKTRGVLRLDRLQELLR